MSKTRVKTPVLLQMEAAECGAASLGIILGYYGKFLTSERLRELTGVNRNGSNARNILLGAEQLGMKGEGFSYTADELKKLKPPFIIHWGFHHFLVCEGWDDNGNFYLNDPASGHRKVEREEFEGMFTGVTLVLRPNENFVRDGKPDSVWKPLLNSLFRERNALIFILALGVCLSLVNVGIPIISQIFFDDVLNYIHREWLFDILLAFVVSCVLRSVLTYLRGWALLRWQGLLTIEDCSKFFMHVLKLPVSFFQTRFVGEIASRVGFHEVIANFVTSSLATTILDVAVAVGYLSLLFLYSVKLTMIGVVFTALNVSVTILSWRWLSEQQLKLQQEAGKMYGLAVSGIVSVETLKANGNESDFFTKWADANSAYLEMAQRQEYYSQFISFVPAMLSGLNTAIIMAVGGFSIMDGLMSVGIFVAFQNLMSSFQDPVNKITGMSQNIQQTHAQMKKIDDVFRYPVAPEKNLSPEEKARVPAKLSGKLELRQINFGYTNGEKPLLKRLNLLLEPGRRVAVVGRSGSGKSTLAKIVSGLNAPWSGEIFFDDIPVEKIPREVLAQSVSVVEQEIFLLEGTIAENIALFNPAVPREDIVRAAKDACIHDDIARLSGGYEAVVDEGGNNFSGGQRQRLEIARALATNPSLLILDEATSALDPVTEKEIMTNVRRRGCSCLIVAHRLSTIRDCDEIIVLNKGRVVQRGVHTELAAVDGYYRKLIQE
ncbi:MAG: NHLP family bacteriocin export ABC transporter peptidase/permease/ATPase subunit [Selenomonadaceae bacterium]|nr:NHLP family bacteriocin export ABC transporter peptidase/permease/ATPase subunit [Selenomonadaceae bacterium]